MCLVKRDGRGNVLIYLKISGRRSSTVAANQSVLIPPRIEALKILIVQAGTRASGLTRVEDVHISQPKLS